MDAVSDFEDVLRALEKHGVEYLVIGGMAFVFHVKPRWTKDMDIWVGNDPGNLRKTNLALAEFGSPHLLDADRRDQVLQIGVAPYRVDVLTRLEGASFLDAWKKRIRSRYGKTQVNWVDLDSLLAIKARIDDPRHREDVRYLRRVREMKRGKAKRAEGRKSHRRLRG